MVSLPTNANSPVYGHRFSSVVPAKVTGDNKIHELTHMDLVTKLHYLRGLYFFRPEAVQGLSISDLKEPMFDWLELYDTVSGRIRRSETGRPYIKCNDSGVRIVEAQCGMTIDEWLEVNKDHASVYDSLLVHDQVLGPDLGFSPLVFLQFTWFKCGGLSMGLSWAHVLGDAFSASAFMTMWGHFVAGQGKALPKSLHKTCPNGSKHPTSTINQVTSIKKVDPVGDTWKAINNSNLETHSLHLSTKQLSHLSHKCGLADSSNVSKFDLLTAVLWKSLARIREGDDGLRIVTICARDAAYISETNEVPSNGMVNNKVEVDFSVSKADVSELVRLIADEKMSENSMIEEMVEKDEGKSDFIAYGANLTFINLEEVDLYGLKLQGHKPVFANYTVSGVGNEGVILILQGPENEKEQEGVGRTVTMILPENDMALLKKELSENWDIV